MIHDPVNESVVADANPISGPAFWVFVAMLRTIAYRGFFGTNELIVIKVWDKIKALIYAMQTKKLLPIENQYIL